MKKMVILMLGLIMLAACSQKNVSYEGTPLKIAVIGEIPEYDNDRVTFEEISLEKFKEDSAHIAKNYNAVMITPLAFDKASKDTYSAVYHKANMPIIFFDSKKRHYPFVEKGMSYASASSDSFNDGSHTTLYVSDAKTNEEEIWTFPLENDDDLPALYTSIFEKIEAL
ncbi:amino acid oxidase [Kurthia populi]|uniref:Amino acid oxidase n=1 Tax=Kurthia populi TaxID=1562132 RepID=A0ABW5Y041_9BACL|nr:amino acid oxidase [Kurthia sp. Dielmo]